MKEILNDYIDFIKNFEKAMKLKYNINVNPWTVAGRLFEKQGSIDDYSYIYHGSGCRLESQGIICEYNVAPLDEKGIKFSKFAFSEFISTHPKYKNCDYNEELIEKGLLKLVDLGVLKWLIIDGRIFKTYIYEK